MKKIDLKPVCVYRNTEHEETTKQQLEQARLVMQRLLDLWYDLNIGSCSDLNELLMRPERAYKNAIDKLIEVPATTGRFPVKKSAHLSTLELPDPTQLYMTAKATRQQPFCASNELWQIVDNTVQLEETEASYLINSQSIYASQPDKIALAKDLNTFCELYNRLNKQLNGELIQGTPWTFNHFRGKFIIGQKTNGGLYEITPEIDYLRSVLQR